MWTCVYFYIWEYFQLFFHPQGRQKLARFNAHEFATLVIDILSDAKRRQQGSPLSSSKGNCFRPLNVCFFGLLNFTHVLKLWKELKQSSIPQLKALLSFIGTMLWWQVSLFESWWIMNISTLLTVIHICLIYEFLPLQSCAFLIKLHSEINSGMT